jgi:hypothetical protein
MHSNHKKLKYKRIHTRKHKRTYKAGALIMSVSNLKNNHLCRSTSASKAMDKYKESPGYEVYIAISDTFGLNEISKDFFLGTFTKANDKWFKFVIFNNDDLQYVYIINGAPINKHSICMLQGLLDVTRKTGEYTDLRKAFNNVIALKSVKGIDASSLEENPLVKQLNEIIARDIPCMPVISAGSGTVNDDGSICLNTKSGHYKPSLATMEVAKTLFEKLTARMVTLIMKEDKNALQLKYGDRYEQFSGICL